MASIYISPEGSGNRSGSSADNAMAIAQLNTAVKAAGAGGEVLLIADRGDYHPSTILKLNNGGTADAPIAIRGVSSTGEPMKASFTGTRSPEFSVDGADGNLLFQLTKGADNLVFSDIQIEDVKTAFHVAGDIANLTIQNVDAANVYRFLENLAALKNPTASIDGLTVRNVDVDGFEKGVIRLQYDTRNVLIQDVHGDAGGQVGDFFAIGVHLDGTVHDVKIVDSSMVNVQNFQGSFLNGDSFATERGVYNVVFEDTFAAGSTDAGYDLKSSNTTLIRAVADDNARNFKLWGDVRLVDVVGTDPHLRGGSGGQVQVLVVAGAHVVIDGGQFIDAGSKSAVFAIEESLSFMDLPKVILADAGTLVKGNAAALPADLGPERIATVGDYSTDSRPALPTPPAEIPPEPTPPSHNLLSAGTDALVATAGRDALVIADGAQGKFAFAGFQSHDIVVAETALADGNRDGIITFGGDRVLDWKGGSLDLGRSITAVRLIGETSDGFVYADAKTKQKGFIEGTTANEVLGGDARDTVADRFFIDNALHVGLGDDVIVRFGQNDRIVVTEQLELDGTGAFQATGGRFDFTADGEPDSVTIAGHSGETIESLYLMDTTVVRGITYYHYGSQTDLLA